MNFKINIPDTSFIFLNKDVSEIQKHSSLINRFLLPEKIEKFSELRKNEFLLGRLCASLATKNLTGQELLNLEISPSRAPLWPNEIVGSISHNQHFVCSLVGLSQRYLSIGIDLEELGRTKLELGKQILHSMDLQTIEGMRPEEVLTIIFSCKEALFKLLHPLVNQFFGFQDAYVDFVDLKNNKFTITLNKNLSSELGAISGQKYNGYLYLEESNCLALLFLTC